MRSPLVVRRVAIRRSPGFDRNRFPVVDNLEPGLNIVWGPNCVGKTTLAEAMRELLWSTRARTRIEADALVELEGESFRLEREGGSLRQIRLADGFISEGRWGGQEESERYFFQLHELLRADARGQRFDEFVRDKIRDGVNLDRANEALGASRALTSSAALNAHRSAEDHLRKVKEAQDGQLEIREQIQAAAERLDQARKAGDELQALRRIEALKAAADQVGAAREALAGFPAAIDRLMPDDPRRLEELDRRAADLARQRRDHGDELEQLEAERTALAVPAGLLGSDLLAGQIQRLCQTIPERQLQRQAAELKQDQAADAVRLWRTQYGWLAPDPPGEAGLEDLVRTLRDLARDCEPLRCQLAATRMRVEDLGEAQPEPAFDSVEHWTRLQVVLGQWQEHASRIVAGEPPLPAWRRHLAAGSALAWVAAALVLSRLLGGAWAGLALFAFLPIYASLNLGRPRTGPESAPAAARAAADREAALKLLAQHPGLIPDPWSPAEVLGLLAESARRIGQARQREACNQQVRAAASRYDDARRAYEQWLDRWSEASRQLGLNAAVPALEGAQFFHFAEGLGDWVKAVQARREADRAAEQAVTLLAQDRARLQEYLAAGGESALAGPEEQVDQARDLLARRAQALDLENRIAGLRKLLDQDLAGEQAATQQIQAFWERCGYPQPDPARLRAAAAQVEAYRTARSTLQARAEAERKLRAATAPDQLERADAWAWEDLRAALQSVGEQAGQLEPLTREHSRLSEQYRQLLDGDALAKALSEVARTRILRDQDLRENAVARAVNLLVQELKAQDLREEQPPVLNRASDWLLRFTRNQFSIGFDLERGYFAHDQAENKLIHLDELSSGTRVQLLFAIRLAFIEEEETPPLTMPLFLDEVLANSDDFRAQDIIQAILEIARDRQVFYFTAQVDEVDKLKLLAGEGNYHEVRLADLQEDRFRSANPLVPVRLATPVVPEPIPDYDAYGQLCDATGVQPGIFEPIEALHAWHLFTRSEDLHRALVRGFVRVGQVLADPVLTDEPVRRSVALLRRAQDLARPGRGRRFQVEDLLDPAFTLANRGAAYWQPMLDEARKANGDGFAFRTGLESVKNLRIRDQIGAWLAEHGFTCPGEPLGVEAILEQIHRENPWLTVASRERQVLERFLRGVLRFTGGAAAPLPMLETL